MRLKPYLAAILACLLAFAAGCGRDTTGGVDVGQFTDVEASQTGTIPLAVGSYTETEVLPLPLEEGETIAPLWLDVEEDSSIGYALQKRSGETGELRWYYAEKGVSFTRQEAFWEEPLRDIGVFCTFLTLLPDGGAVACMDFTKDNQLSYSFYRITPDGQREEINIPEDWDPRSITVTKTGKWLAASVNNLDVVSWYDAPGGNKLGEISSADRLLQPYGDYLAAVSTAGDTRELALYDLNTGEVLRRQEVSEEAVGSQITAVGFGKDSVYVSGNNGLCRLGISDGVWEKRIASGAFSFFSTTKTSGYLRETDDGSLYVVTGGKLLKLTYDPDGVPKTGKPFRITTMVQESPVLHQMAEEFQMQHPELDVQLEEDLAGLSSVDTAETFAPKWKEAVKELEAQLAAGEGPDLLILEELPTSLLQKDYFLDLNGKVSLEGLLPNVMNAYEQDGKLFALPLSFSVPLMIGTDQSLVQRCSTLDGMAQEAAQAPKAQEYQDPRNVSQKNLMYFSSSGEQAESLYPLLQPARNADGSYDGDAIDAFLQQGKSIFQTCAGRNTNNSPFFISNLMYGYRDSPFFSNCLSDELRIRFANQISNFYEPVDAPTYLSLLPGNVEGGFLPTLGVAVPKASANQETALAFIQYALSREGQSLDKFQTFHLSVREDLLTEQEALYQQGLHHSAINFQDGTSIQSANQITPTAMELIRSLKTPVFIDRELMDAICWPAIDYWRGDVTLEEAKTKIQQNLDALETQ